MKRVLFYCQHLLGIGHVSRSLAVVNELSRSFAVTYVQGGPPVPKRARAGVLAVQLDPLLMREVDSALYDPEGKRSVEEIFAARDRQLAVLTEARFDAVVVELYPFGRKKFGQEVQVLLERLRAKNPKIKAIVSVRDILVSKNDGREPKVAAIVRDQFDAVWVHSDPALVRFEDSFAAADMIRDKLVYTGFVAEPASGVKRMREKKILLSLGGGSVGAELYIAAARIVKDFPEHRFQFVMGPYTDPALCGEVERITGGDRVEFSELLPDFEAALAGAELSLSMGGYNTVMNLLNTRTPALVLAYDANLEQRTRAALLAQRGFLGLLEREDLRPEPFARLIRERLSLPYPEVVPDLGGARRSREHLERFL